MPVVKNTRNLYEVKVNKVINLSNSKGKLVRVFATEENKSLTTAFDAWDSLADYIQRDIEPGNYLMIDAADYEYPQTGDRTKKIYKYTNLSTNYDASIVITNEKCHRGVPGKNRKCFCGKRIENSNKKPVIHFYIEKPNKLDMFIVKGKKCRIRGKVLNEINKDKHNKVLVNDIYWI